MHGALSGPVLKWPLLSNEYFVHFWALCLQSNFFVPWNFEKSLETVSCKGILCVIIQFTRVGYNFLLFLSFQISPLHSYFLTARVKSCSTYMLLIFLIHRDSKNLITNNRFKQSNFFLSFSENSRSPNKNQIPFKNWLGENTWLTPGMKA